MKCSIINIGTELNLGVVLNTNSKYLAENIFKLGLECNYIHTVRDNEEEIAVILKDSLKYSDLIIISGGLGPTDDDVTRNAVAKTLGLKLVRLKSLDETSLRFIRRIKTSQVRNRLLKQSYIPEGSISIKPRIGSASGFILNLKSKNKWIFCIPGVPKEMKSMFEWDILPVIKDIIKERANTDGKLVIRKSELMTTDISETEIEEKIKNIVKEAKKINVEVGITATPGLIKLILVSKSLDKKICERNLTRIEGKIHSVLDEYVYGKNDPLISESIKRAIINKNRNITISTAESMTGGLISSIITEIPGSSKFFLGGIVSYSNFTKIKLLGVNENDLENYGAVSKKVCIDMAEGAKRIFESDFTLSVTGFAGPEVNEENKEVGLVYCCILGPNDSRQIFERRFIGDRNEIRFRAAQFILNKLRITIEKAIN